MNMKHILLVVLLLIPSVTQAYWPGYNKSIFKKGSIELSTGFSYASQLYTVKNTGSTSYDDYQWIFPLTTEYWFTDKMSAVLSVPYASSQLTLSGSINNRLKAVGLGQTSLQYNMIIGDCKCPLFICSILVDIPTQNTAQPVALGKRYNAQEPQGFNTGILVDMIRRIEEIELSARLGALYTGPYTNSLANSFNPGEIILAGVSAFYTPPINNKPLKAGISLQATLFGNSSTGGTTNLNTSGTTIDLIPEFDYLLCKDFHIKAGCNISLGAATYRSYNTLFFVNLIYTRSFNSNSF